MKYPELSKELVALEAADQLELTNLFQGLNKLKTETQRTKVQEETNKHIQIRTNRMQDILKEIVHPTISNIGVRGSRALNTLALHSTFSVQKQILEIYQNIFSKNPLNVYAQGIPPLVDKIMIVEERKQLFGSQWSVSSNGAPFLIEVRDFEGVNQRRAEYRLKPIQKCVILSVGADKYPLGRGPAEASDQKELNDDEYARVVKFYRRA